MNYYEETQYIAQVDEQGSIVDRIEKWKAHQEGLLHKAFTLSLQYKEYIILQHRKHPAFDGYYDLALSSHYLYRGDTLETDEEAALLSLEREWGLTKADLSSPITNRGFVVYKEKDPQSEFTEHEVDYLLQTSVTSIPLPKLEYAYGVSLLTLEQLKNPAHPIQPMLAPWVKKILEANLLTLQT